MSERKKFFNNPFSVRFSNDEYILREEQFAEMNPDLDPDDAMTNRIVFNTIFDRAFSKYEKGNVPRKEDQDTIEQLINEIGRLKIEIDLKNERIKDLTSNCNDLTLICNEKNAEISEIKNTALAENQRIITIPPIIAKVLEIEAATAKRKTGKDYSYEDVLMQSFWDSVKVGRAYPWRTWSGSELAKIATDLKAAE